jgi:hypothetical protein
MTRIELLSLRPGDIILGALDGQAYIVTRNYGQHATAVKTVDVTNPSEWELVSRVTKREGFRVDQHAV